MSRKQIISWLLTGDVAIQYQVHRDLLGNDRSDLQERIAHEGWGKRYLSKRHSNGHWGDRYYQPKWKSTHYTLLDLRNVCLSPNNEIVRATINIVLNAGLAEDGGIPLGPSTAVHSDVCVNAMFLNVAAYFKIEEQKLTSIVDSILKESMPDGGFNCQTTREGSTHSSVHTTLSVLEGLVEFQRSGYPYRKKDITKAIAKGEEFLLMHQLFLSDHTGEIINKNFLKMSYPSRWKYDILRALDYFQYAGRDWDDRMQKAIEVLIKKRGKNGRWKMPAAHPGKVHFTMENAGVPSRWNTLRALRVLSHFGIDG